MLYDLDIFKSPVIISFDNTERRYTDGAAAKAEAVFPKPVIVCGITARDNDIVIDVKENSSFNDTNWNKTGEVSFF